MNDFLKRLKAAIEQFDLKEAVALSKEIHQAEEDGYTVSREEDKLWGRLTEKILQESGNGSKDRDSYENMS